MKETDIAKAAADRLEQLGWDVYPEVVPFPGGARADLVAVRGGPTGGEVLIVEAKRAVTMRLLAQAVCWSGWANRVVVAALVPRDTASATVVLNALGLGWMPVSAAGPSGAHVVSTDLGPWQRAPRAGIVRSRLVPEQKLHAPGNADGAYFTERDRAHKAIADFVKAWQIAAVAGHPVDPAPELKFTLRKLGIKPTPELVSDLRRGKVDRVQAKRSGRSWFLWPTAPVF